jgi:hypothetical protein
MIRVKLVMVSAMAGASESTVSRNRISSAVDTFWGAVVPPDKVNCRVGMVSSWAACAWGMNQAATAARRTVRGTIRKAARRPHKKTRPHPHPVVFLATAGLWLNAIDMVTFRLKRHFGQQSNICVRHPEQQAFVHVSDSHDPFFWSKREAVFNAHLQPATHKRHTASGYAPDHPECGKKSAKKKTQYGQGCKISLEGKIHVRQGKRRAFSRKGGTGAQEQGGHEQTRN